MDRERGQGVQLEGSHISNTTRDGYQAAAVGARDRLAGWLGEPVVCSLWENSEILRSIVVLDPVEVIDDFVCRQNSAQHLGHDPPMLEDVAVPHRHRMVRTQF